MSQLFLCDNVSKAEIIISHQRRKWINTNHSKTFRILFIKDKNELLWLNILFWVSGINARFDYWLLRTSALKKKEYKDTSK